jgi:2-polyprenyl-3-methyl-5-hydroxy-6-metoxy-1,4-benzoquinol methylase
MDESMYRMFAQVEERHWWFVARRRILEDQIVRVLGLPTGASVLDVGCGTGGMLRTLRDRYDVSGLDASATAVRLCHEAGLSGVVEGTLGSFPFPGRTFDLILLLDVIEHITDEVEALRTCRPLLKPNGRILITVPAYQFLWSKHDELNHHYRRYDRSLLRKRLATAGFAIESSTYFNTFLFPAALAQRLLRPNAGGSADETLAVPPTPINGLLTALFGAERVPLRYLRLPFGLSLLAVVRPV